MMPNDKAQFDFVVAYTLAPHRIWDQSLHARPLADRRHPGICGQSDRWRSKDPCSPGRPNVDLLDKPQPCMDPFNQAPEEARTNQASPKRDKMNLVLESVVLLLRLDR